MKDKHRREFRRFIADVLSLAQLARDAKRPGPLPDLFEELHARSESLLELDMSTMLRARVVEVRNALWELRPSNPVWYPGNIYFGIVRESGEGLQALAESLKGTLDDEGGSEGATKAGLDVVQRALHADHAVPPALESPPLAAQREALRSELDPLLPRQAHSTGQSAPSSGVDDSAKPGAGQKRRIARSPAPPGWIYATEACEKFRLNRSTLQGYLLRIRQKNPDDVVKDETSKQVRVREKVLRQFLGTEAI